MIHLADMNIPARLFLANNLILFSPLISNSEQGRHAPIFSNLPPRPAGTCHSLHPLSAVTSKYLPHTTFQKNISAIETFVAVITLVFGGKFESVHRVVVIRKQWFSPPLVSFWRPTFEVKRPDPHQNLRIILFQYFFLLPWLFFACKETTKKYTK